MTEATRQNSPALVGALFMVSAGLTFALVNTSLQALTMRMGMSSPNAAFWQYFIAALFSLPLIFRIGLKSMRTVHLRIHLLRVAMAVLGVQFWTAGLAHVPIWQAIALVMTSPFFVTFGAWLFLKETVSLSRWAATAVGFTGGLIILAPWSDKFSLYTFLPVLAAMFWAGASLLTKRLTTDEEAEKVTIYLLVLLTPINALLAFGAGDLSLPTGNTTGLIIVAGLLTVLAQWFLTRAYSIADASYVQPFDHLKLPLNVLAGWVVFGFVPGGNLWLGAALIIAASLYIVRQETRKGAEG
jgi:S-adenosylmethionine uptake transporter